MALSQIQLDSISIITTDAITFFSALLLHQLNNLLHLRRRTIALLQSAAHPHLQVTESLGDGKVLADGESLEERCLLMRVE